jgi:hypothetical protein
MLAIMLGAIAYGVLLLVRLNISAGCIHPDVRWFQAIDEKESWYWCAKCKRYLRGPAIHVKPMAGGGQQRPGVAIQTAGEAASQQQSGLLGGGLPR